MSIFRKAKKEEAVVEVKEAKKEMKIAEPVKTDNKSQGSADLKSNKSIVKHVWITEKSVNLSRLGKYVFVVDKNTNKSEVRKAIESIYGVNVNSVNIVRVKGKERHFGRSRGKTQEFKKAIVSLRKGQAIDIMPT